ncbi:MAG: UDP-N-acetylglucosamine 4,6-dehydratase (inverting) [Crocinitomicaceae bacterium]|nr:UDP-N-acetylglucosamine 4,6-dehydratase (inverting) [Crocinitomicaceae bacterium]|tara:strand:- start:13606 stop:14586 length:981 start_codon:yes stop_codon:yes gene_type:complete
MKINKILITGGTGSLGKALTKEIFIRYPNIGSVIVFSRDEQKHFQMREEFPMEKFPKLQFLLGDVRDYDSVKSACKDVDYIIHAAAMKHVHLSEMNPEECIKTNVLGAQNITKIANSIVSVKSVVALSTDKACAPINLYGATKLTSDKLFVAANNNSSNTLHSVVRYGNVMSSNGSVIPFFLNKKKSGTLPITDPKMTRFNISLQEGVNMVLFALEKAWGGEIFVPKIPSYNIMDLAKAIDPNCKIKVIGIRPGEKVHEEMISSSDSYNTYDIGRYYTILPNTVKWNVKEFIEKFKAKKVPIGFNYNSKENDSFLSVEKLRALIYS